MLCLFQTVSEGRHWSDLLSPLYKYCSPWFALGFVLYVLLAILAMMNILTGIFVESAIQTAYHDSQKRVEEHIRRVFREQGLERGNMITYQELELLLASKTLSTSLVALEITEVQVMELFHLLDQDSDGTLDREGFIEGLLKFSGNLKATDFAAFMYEWRQTSDQLEAFLHRQHTKRRTTDNAVKA